VKAIEGVNERLVGAAAHVCEILDCFSLEQPTRSLTEIAAVLGLQKSSVHRLLRTLVVHRYLAVDPGTRRYRLGERIASRARVYAAAMNVAMLVRPYLERLSAETGETATLQERRGDERRVVAQVASSQAIRFVDDDSRSHPLTPGATGYLFRAFAPDWDEQADRTKLARVRADGYAVSRGEITDGAIAIYVPLGASEERPLRYALGVQAPEFRVSASKLKTIVTKLRRAATELGEAISAEL
jgi:DNA-binding IclR family transcriptional regulator